MGHLELVKVISAGHLGKFDRVHEAVNVGFEFKEFFVETSCHLENAVAIKQG